MLFIEMTNFSRKTRAEWSDFSDELEDSDDSLQTACGWRNGNTIGKASVSVGKRTFDKNNFCLKQNELAEVQYRDSVYDDIPITARHQLPNKRLSHLSKPSDCLNVSDSDMSLAITHGSSMGTYRTVPNHRGSCYNMSASHGIQTSSSSPYIGHRVRKKSGFETPRDGNTLQGYNTFRNMNGSKDASNAITEKDVSRLIEAVQTKCLSPAKIKLLQKVLDSTAEGSPMSKKRHPKMMRPARASTSKRRTNKLYQAKRKSFNAKSDSSDLSSAETDCSDNTINTMRPSHTNNNKMYSTRVTEFKFPSNGLHRKVNERTKPLSTYDLRNDAMSNVTAESHIRGVGPAHSTYLSINENSFYPNHRSTMLNVDCVNQSSMTNMSMRPSFIRRKLYTQSQEYIADGNENSFDGRRAVPNIYANAEEDISKRSSRRSVLPRYSRSRRSSNTYYLQTRRQTSVRQVNVTPVLERLIDKCNTTGFRNKYLPDPQKRNTAESADVSVHTPTERSTSQPLKKKLFIISDSDQLTDDVASDCNTEVKISKDRLVEPNPQQQEDNGSPTLNFANQKNTKKPEVIIPCYVRIRKEDIITNTGSFTKTSLGNEKGIQYNKFQSSLLSSPSDGEPAKDDIGMGKNISNFSERQISTYKARMKAKNFGNVEYNTAPLIIDSIKTDEPLNKLTSLSIAKPDNSLKNPTLSIETSYDDCILNNGNKKVQSSKSISRKSLSLNKEERNVSTRSSYFLRPKTVINNLNDDSDLNNELTQKGQKIKTLNQRVTRNCQRKIDEKVNEEKACKFGKIQKAAVAQKKQGCTIKNVQTVKKTRQQNEADKEISSTLEVSVQSDSVTCQNTKQLNKSSNLPSTNTKCSKSVAKKVNQTSTFWNLSSSSNEDDELNKERMNSSDKRITHNVPDLEARVGDEVPVKAVHLATDGATLEMVSIRHNMKTASVEQQLCLNVQENYKSLNIPTQQSEQEPITNIKRSRVLPSFLNKSERVAKRNTSVDDAENFLIPIITVDFKHTNNVNNKCNSVIEMNIKPRSSSRYERLYERNKFLNENDGCCSVLSLNTLRTRRRKTRFVNFF